jgi:hypothetical protein
MTALANQNFEEAKGYQDEILSRKRNEYYEKVKQELRFHENN